MEYCLGARTPIEVSENTQADFAIFSEFPVWNCSSKAPGTQQLSRDIRGPWKISFTGIGTGIYPSHLQACSCHRLLSHRSKSQTEEFLQLANDLQVTVFRCDCPGIIQEKGTEFNLSLLWQLSSNHRQLLKQRLVLIRPQYIFGNSESRLKIIYRGDNPGEFYSAMASRV